MTVAAVSAYLKKGMAAGIDILSLAEAFAYDVTESEIRTELVHAYRLAVANDEELLEEGSPRFRLSLYALIVGLVALLAGTTRFLSLGGGYSWVWSRMQGMEKPSDASFRRGSSAPGG